MTQHNETRGALTNGTRELTMTDRNFVYAGNGFISDENFDFDAALRVSGDFVGDDKDNYCRMIVTALNAVPSLPAGDGLTDLRDRIEAAIEAVEDQDNHAALAILRTILAAHRQPDAPPNPPVIDTAPMYKALDESRLALLAVNSAASQKAIAMIDAILNCAPRQPGEVGAGVLTGWKLVPTFPTRQMVADARVALGDNADVTDALIAAIAAAPTASAQQDEREAFERWVSTVWRPDDGAELLKREFPRMAFAAWQARADNAGPISRVYICPEADVECSKCGNLDVPLCATQQVQADAGAVAEGYGATDFGYTFAGIELAEGDKRLMSMLVKAFGTDHPAVDDMAALLFRARPAAESDKRDAERYRWLRDNVHNESSLWDVHGPDEFTMGVDDLNTAIDAAMSREQSGGEPK
ncbi:hypothetical protein [Ensifer sp. SSB1]|uniref:hypothetical protein n=1 Tax=Ensifer sp. SSB1 TaxID=2795385 RepID=UPI001A4B694D|nr:hypothetical protein [Ensifer sp. SSB1]MBK5570116.1 hypothetical protein [Ensifer sp. SSB1]